MKKNSILTFCFIKLFLLQISFSHAQNYQWAESMGGVSSYCEGFASAINSHGDYCVGGFLDGSVDFDPGIGVYNLSSSGNTIIFIAKYNSSGNLIWAKDMQSTPSSASHSRLLSLKTDSSDNIYISGYFDNTTDFDPGAAVHNLVPADGDEDMYIAKYDSAGNYVWAFGLGDSLDNSVSKIELDSSANIYITGFFNGHMDMDPGPGTSNLYSNGFDDMFIAKYNSNGILVWAKNIGGYSFEDVRSIGIDAAANIILFGRYTDSCDFDPGPGSAMLYAPSAYPLASYLAKYDSSGNFLWAKSFLMPPGYLDFNSIKTDPLNNIYVTGYYYGTIDFNPGPAVQNMTATSGGDIFFAKYDPDGNYLWEKSIYSSAGEGRSLALDAQNNIYLTGVFQLATDFDPGTSVHTLALTGQADAFIAKYDEDGNYVWAEDIGGPLGEVGESMVLDLQDIYLTGRFNGTCDFDPSSSTATFTSEGFYDMYIAKYSKTTVGTGELENQSVNVYPNPLSNVLTIEQSAGNPLRKVTVYATDGRKVFEETIKEHSSSVNIDLNKLPGGIYFLDCGFEKILRTVKVVKY